jgi:hypothetical protein
MLRSSIVKKQPSKFANQRFWESLRIQRNLAHWQLNLYHKDAMKPSSLYDGPLQLYSFAKGSLQLLD